MTGGDALLRRSGKAAAIARDGASWKADISLSKLGYTTANGAYYYYNTEPAKNYQETMLDLKAYADREKIPISWILYDSWWYLKESETNTPAQTAAVVDWRDAMPSIFPDGLRHMWNATGWPVVAHNREWSPKAAMAARNARRSSPAEHLIATKCAVFAQLRPMATAWIPHCR